MVNNGGKKVLNTEKRMLVLRMYAEGVSCPDIARKLLKDDNIKISRNGIYNTCVKEDNQFYIEQFKESFLANIKDVPIANKRIRLEKFEKMGNRLLNQMDKNQLKTKEEKTLFLSYCAELRKILAETREEMEKKPYLFQQAVLNMGTVSDEQLFQQKEQLIAEYRKLTRGENSEASSSPTDIESADFNESPEVLLASSEKL